MFGIIVVKYPLYTRKIYIVFEILHYEYLYFEYCTCIYF